MLPQSLSCSLPSCTPLVDVFTVPLLIESDAATIDSVTIVISVTVGAIYAFFIPYIIIYVILFFFLVCTPARRAHFLYFYFTSTPLFSAPRSIKRSCHAVTEEFENHCFAIMSFFPRYLVLLFVKEELSHSD